MSVPDHIKLSELTNKITEVIKNSFSDFYWIIAEVSGHKFYPNQDRHYFDFIEKEEGRNDPIAKASAVAWLQGSQCIKVFEKETGQIFTNGLEVLVKVKVEFHSAYGLKLILVDINQSYTLGNLEKQKRDTLIKLIANNPTFIKKVGEYYLTLNNQLKFSLVIQKIAIIGSPNSEGYNDFIHTLNSNLFNYTFSTDIYQSSVQGEYAAQEIISRLIAIHQSNIKYDCVVIIRGGGAKTDLIAFDSYDLSRAAAKFPIPIITGIGHHRDVSIVDLMIKEPTKTPTKAAEFIVSHNKTTEDLILNLQKSIVIKTQQLLSNSRRKINATNVILINKSRTFLNKHKELINNTNNLIINKTKTKIFNEQTRLVSLLNQLLSKPKIITSNKNNDLINLINNLKIYSNKYFVNNRGYIGHYHSIVKLMNPKNILKKGFAIVNFQGRILKDGETIVTGNELKITMNTYEINTKVISKIKKDGSESIL